MKSRLFIGILIVTHEYYLPIYLDSMAPYIKQIAKSFGHCLSDCKNKETSINLASKKTNKQSPKKRRGGWILCYLFAGKIRITTKKGARFYHYHYIHPGVFFFFFFGIVCFLQVMMREEFQVRSLLFLPRVNWFSGKSTTPKLHPVGWQISFPKILGPKYPLQIHGTNGIYIYARWWQLKYFPNNYPENWGNDSQFDEHIFQLVWFNHQLVKISGNVKGRLFFLWKLYSL